MLAAIPDPTQAGYQLERDAFVARFPHRGPLVIRGPSQVIGLPLPSGRAWSTGAGLAEWYVYSCLPCRVREQRVTIFVDTDSKLLEAHSVKDKLDVNTEHGARTGGPGH
jgi:hypothetical protein